MADGFKDMNAASKAKRESNRVQGAIALMEAGVPYTVHNDGAHIVIPRQKPYATIDYWPGTGKWGARGWGYYKRGIRSLLAFLKEVQK
jgi:hypothetical protein